MNNEVVDARALTHFLENRLKDLLMYASWGAQPSAACGSAAGALENVLSFVKENTVPADSIICMHKMETLQERDAALEQIWKQFADHPINPETEKIEAPFLHLPMSNDDYFVSFDAGTPKEDIWLWFDERHSKGVWFLLYGKQTCSSCHETYWSAQNQFDIDDVKSYIAQLSDEDVQSKYHVDRNTICKLIPAAATKMRKFIDNDDSWTFHRDSAIERTVKDYLKGEIQL